MARSTPPVPSAADQPRYLWLADVIRTTIEGGQFGDKAALPSERELAEKYEVSRDTVRKTVRYLEERGVLYSDHGRGTFVAPAIVRRMTRFLDSFSQDTQSRGGVAGQRILAVEPASASMAMAGMLGVDPGHALVRVRRVRLVNDRPVGLHDAYLPAHDGVMIDRAALEKTGSLYALLSEGFGIIPAEAIENLGAIRAEAEDAQLLDVEPGSPLLLCERITLSERREPIEYCLMKYVPSYRYSMRITKRSAAG